MRVHGRDIAFERVGDGPVIVLLHGAMSDSRAWRPQLEGLRDEFTVVAWDEPGTGGSADPPEGFTLADYADCLDALLAGLDLPPAHVAGLSWGGVLAQELYRRHPERVASLILADTYAGWKGSLPEEEVRARVAAGLRQADLPAQEIAENWPGLLSEYAPADVVEEVRAMIARTRPVSLRCVVRAVGACDQRDLLPRIAVPTLLLWGDADARSPRSVAEAFHAAIPGSRLVLIPGAGHVSNLEAPERFTAEVRAFVRACEAEGV